MTPTDTATPRTDPLGSCEQTPDGGRLTYERTYDASAAVCWTALTDPGSVGRWLDALTVHATGAGGSFEVLFEGEHTNRYTITACEPGRVLEVVWHGSGDGGPDSTVRVELTPVDAGTRLVLTHSGLPAGSAHEYGAGWHWHLEAYACEVEPGPRPQWHPRFDTLLDQYRALLAR